MSGEDKNMPRRAKTQSKVKAKNSIEEIAVKLAKMQGLGKNERPSCAPDIRHIADALLARGSTIAPYSPSSDSNEREQEADKDPSPVIITLCPPAAYDSQGERQMEQQETGDRGRHVCTAASCGHLKAKKAGPRQSSVDAGLPNNLGVQLNSQTMQGGHSAHNSNSYSDTFPIFPLGSATLDALSSLMHEGMRGSNNRGRGSSTPRGYGGNDAIDVGAVLEQSRGTSSKRGTRGSRARSSTTRGRKNTVANEAYQNISDINSYQHMLPPVFQDFPDGSHVPFTYQSLLNSRLQRMHHTAAQNLYGTSPLDYRFGLAAMANVDNLQNSNIATPIRHPQIPQSLPTRHIRNSPVMMPGDEKRLGDIESIRSREPSRVDPYTYFPIEMNPRPQTPAAHFGGNNPSPSLPNYHPQFIPPTFHGNLSSISTPLLPPMGHITTPPRQYKLLEEFRQQQQQQQQQQPRMTKNQCPPSVNTPNRNALMNAGVVRPRMPGLSGGMMYETTDFSVEKLLTPDKGRQQPCNIPECFVPKMWKTRISDDLVALQDETCVLQKNSSSQRNQPEREMNVPKRRSESHVMQPNTVMQKPPSSTTTNPSVQFTNTDQQILLRADFENISPCDSEEEPAARTAHSPLPPLLPPRMLPVDLRKVISSAANRVVPGEVANSFGPKSAPPLSVREEDTYDTKDYKKLKRFLKKVKEDNNTKEPIKESAAPNDAFYDMRMGIPLINPVPESTVVVGLAPPKSTPVAAEPPINNCHNILEDLLKRTIHAKESIEGCSSNKKLYFDPSYFLTNLTPEDGKTVPQQPKKRARVDSESDDIHRKKVAKRGSYDESNVNEPIAGCFMHRNICDEMRMVASSENSVPQSTVIVQQSSPSNVPIPTEPGRNVPLVTGPQENGASNEPTPGRSASSMSTEIEREGSNMSLPVPNRESNSNERATEEANDEVDMNDPVTSEDDNNALVIDTSDSMINVEQSLEASTSIDSQSGRNVTREIDASTEPTAGSSASSTPGEMEQEDSRGSSHVASNPESDNQESAIEDADDDSDNPDDSQLGRHEPLVTDEQENDATIAGSSASLISEESEQEDSRVSSPVPSNPEFDHHERAQDEADNDYAIGDDEDDNDQSDLVVDIDHRPEAYNSDDSQSESDHHERAQDEADNDYAISDDEDDNDQSDLVVDIDHRPEAYNSDDSQSEFDHRERAQDEADNDYASSDDEDDNDQSVTGASDLVVNIDQSPEAYNSDDSQSGSYHERAHEETDDDSIMSEPFTSENLQDGSVIYITDDSPSESEETQETSVEEHPAEEASAEQRPAQEASVEERPTQETAIVVRPAQETAVVVRPEPEASLENQIEIFPGFFSRELMPVTETGPVNIVTNQDQHTPRFILDPNPIVFEWENAPSVAEERFEVLTIDDGSPAARNRASERVRWKSTFIPNLENMAYDCISPIFFSPDVNELDIETGDDCINTSMFSPMLNRNEFIYIILINGHNIFLPKLTELVRRLASRRFSSINYIHQLNDVLSVEGRAVENVPDALLGVVAALEFIFLRITKKNDYNFYSMLKPLTQVAAKYLNMRCSLLHHYIKIGEWKSYQVLNVNTQRITATLSTIFRQSLESILECFLFSSKFEEKELSNVTIPIIQHYMHNSVFPSHGRGYYIGILHFALLKEISLNGEEVVIQARRTLGLGVNRVVELQGIRPILRTETSCPRDVTGHLLKLVPRKKLLEGYLKYHCVFNDRLLSIEP